MIKNSLLTLFSLLCIFICLEIGVRIFCKHEVDSEIIKQNNSRVSIKPIIQYSEDYELLFENKPNLNVSFLNVPFITDKDGVRVDKIINQSIIPDIKIALMGDSTAVGWGVRFEDTYGEQLRKILTNDLKVLVEVKNFSVTGYNALQELRQFDTKISSYKPDLLIIHHDHNDYEPTGMHNSPPNFLPHYYGDNLFHSSLIKFIIRRIIFTKIKKQYIKLQRMEQHEFVQNYPVSGPLYDEMIQARKKLIKKAIDQNISVLIVIFNCCPQLDQNYQQGDIYRKLHLMLAVILQQEGCYILDLFPKYQELMKKNNWPNLHQLWNSVNPMDAHPNAYGHKFIASQLAGMILNHKDLRRGIGIDL